MKRLSILVPALLALIVAGCAETTSPSPTATVTAEPTASPTQEPSATPDATDGTGGSDTPLADLIPDELNGMPRVDIPGMEAMLGPALEEMGADASEAEFVIAAYGEGDEAVALNAFRVPGMSDLSMQTLAGMLSGADAGGEIDAEEVTVGGKSVLRMTSPETVGTVYLYFAEGAVFSIGSESPELAEQLLAELP